MTLKRGKKKRNANEKVLAGIELQSGVKGFKTADKGAE